MEIAARSVGQWDKLRLRKKGNALRKHANGKGWHEKKMSEVEQKVNGQELL